MLFLRNKIILADYSYLDYSNFPALGHVHLLCACVELDINTTVLCLFDCLQSIQRIFSTNFPLGCRHVTIISL